MASGWPSPLHDLDLVTVNTWSWSCYRRNNLVNACGGLYLITVTARPMSGYRHCMVLIWLPLLRGVYLVIAMAWP
jgi:hypothetical protein